MSSTAGDSTTHRGRSDHPPQRWWFASTAIPLIVVTIGPLSHVLSIASLVSPWRITLPNGGRGLDDLGVGIADPQWEIISNIISLIFGLAGNVLLLLNFVGRVRYIVALPLATLCWVLSSVILIAIELAMHIYVPPEPPADIYSQGFWHAVLASCFYFFGSVLLMINMLGYLRGHYSQKLDLDDDQRTLILQTMMFFFWLAGGAGVFCALEGFTYADALYYADVSVLTIGFGDFAPKTDGGRGFLFIFQLLGIVFLSLVISSISRFAASIGADKIIRKHQLHAREATVGRAVSNESELRSRLGLPQRSNKTAAVDSERRRSSLAKYGRFEFVGRTVTFREHRAQGGSSSSNGIERDKRRARASGEERRKQRRQKLLLLPEEKDRFEAMRQIQDDTRRWKQYWALAAALLAFFALWCFGALVFMMTEARSLDLKYFDALYFCWVALLTIGYGDISPRSNIGKPFFIVWSLLAVPIVTVLIQEMFSTVVTAFNLGTFIFADWTIMPRKGVLDDFLAAHPSFRGFLNHWQQRRRIAGGFTVHNPADPGQKLDGNSTSFSTREGITPAPTMSENEENNATTSKSIAKPSVEADTEQALARQLAIAIKSVAHDLRCTPPRRYSFEEWAQFTKLIRFSRPTTHSEEDKTEEEGEREEDEEEGLVEWDWIGDNSPMLADVAEAEWVLDRLCESLARYMQRLLEAR
ncbi:hypothetical protein B0T22DRAFT_438915 [Podospora appendiculata]|uniref:Potassium channel domain-containing protein n=1 Tax=Podospora appendiculata TaxID=314037 RepID=A0AAE0X771_9PEZI|nr:hypothetical protein B0T22DRAFT_438915 [Podospora appendiculata]